MLLCMVLVSELGWVTEGETHEPGTLVRAAGGGERSEDNIPSVELKLELPPGIAINVGNRPLTIEEALAEPAEFRVQESFPLTIGPVQTAEIPVLFNPGREGLIEGSLTLKSNDTHQPLSTVALRGVGAFPYQ